MNLESEGPGAGNRLLVEIHIHRTIASQAFNRCWVLLEQSQSPERDQELLSSAFVSRFHWERVGSAQEFAIGDWMISRAFAAINEAALALAFAQRSLEYDQTGFAHWLKASLFEGMARAYAVGKEGDKKLKYLELAQKELEQELDAEDAEIISKQFADLLE